MSSDTVMLKVPRDVAMKIAERAVKKDAMRKWSDEAREILAAAVEE